MKCLWMLVALVGFAAGCSERKTHMNFLKLRREILAKVDAEIDQLSASGQSTQSRDVEAHLKNLEEQRDAVIAHNRLADVGEKSFRLSLNQFSHLKNEEFRLRNGYRRDLSRRRSDQLEEGEEPWEQFSSQRERVDGKNGGGGQVGDDGLPAYVDYRNTSNPFKKVGVTSVKDQGQCGSCYTFSAVAALEGQQCLQGNYNDLSEQNLVDCTTSYGNGGCNGGLMTYCYKYIIKNPGVSLDSPYPYKGVQGKKCLFNSKNKGAACKSFTNIPEYNEQALKQALATHGPVCVAIDASWPSMQSYSSGIYNEPQCSQDNLDHGVTCVGYGSENGQDYWIVKNSWSNTWGEQGYIRMARGANQCGIATDACYPSI